MASAMTVDENVDNKEECNTEQYVTFQMADEVFGFMMSTVLEIIRLPKTIEVPLTPNSLLGLANLRGSVLPVLDLRNVLQLDETQYGDATRVIVCDVGTPIGLVVDKVARVINVEAEQIDSSTQIQTTLKADMLAGVIKGKEGETLTQLLNVESLISTEYSDTLQSSLFDNHSIKNDTHFNTLIDDEDDNTAQLVSFSVENQEYAFDLMDVEEIVRVPESIAKVPGVEEHVLGLIDLRGRLLPLVSLRRMFSLSEAKICEDNRILVVNIQKVGGRKSLIGLVVDDVKEVLRVSNDLQDDMPSLLQEKGESEISHIYRLNDGQRLVSVLSVNTLFKHPAIQTALKVNEVEEETEVKKEIVNNHDEEDIAQFVVFHLGEQEFGVSIDDVQEITRLPEKLDKVPKTADFIEGMVNLRGTVLPVLDMRSRFGMDKMEQSDRQRIIVLSLDGKHTGFVVDFVAEVLRLPRSNIEDAPKLSNDQMRIMGKVVNLKESKRMIQILAVKELLSEQEKISLELENIEV